jgi:hypothetical protein
LEEVGLGRKQLAVFAGAMVLAGCGSAAAEPRDPVDCGVALIIESYYARTYGSPRLAEDLSPVIKWYTAKGASLPPERRTEAQGMALMERFKADPRLRKEIAKSCVKDAMTDPLYHQLMPELQASIRDPLTGK